MIALKIALLIAMLCAVRCGILSELTDDESILGQTGLGGISNQGKDLVNSQVAHVANIVKNKPQGIMKKAGNLVVNQQANIRQSVSGNDAIKGVQKAAMDTLIDLSGDDMKILEVQKVAKKKKGKKAKTTTTTPEPEDDDE